MYRVTGVITVLEGVELLILNNDAWRGSLRIAKNDKVNPTKFYMGTAKCLNSRTIIFTYVLRKFHDGIQ